MLNEIFECEMQKNLLVLHTICMIVRHNQLSDDKPHETGIESESK